MILILFLLNVSYLVEYNDSSLFLINIHYSVNNSNFIISYSISNILETTPCLLKWGEYSSIPIGWWLIKRQKNSTIIIRIWWLFWWCVEMVCLFKGIITISRSSRKMNWTRKNNHYCLWLKGHKHTPVSYEKGVGCDLVFAILIHVKEWYFLI